MMGNDAAEGGAVQGHNAREAEAAGQAPAPLPAQRPGQGLHHGQRPPPLILRSAPFYSCITHLPLQQRFHRMTLYKSLTPSAVLRRCHAQDCACSLGSPPRTGLMDK